MQQRFEIERNGGYWMSSACEQDVGESEAKAALLKQSYKLGYEVGYFNHIEWFGWVAREKEKLLRDGKRLNALSEVLAEYKKGFWCGRKKRIRDLCKIIGKKLKVSARGAASIADVLPANVQTTSTRKQTARPSSIPDVVTTEHLFWLEKAIPSISFVLRKNIGRLEAEIKTNTEFIQVQKENIRLMDEGIAICNKLIAERKKEIAVLEKNMAQAKAAVETLERLKSSIAAIAKALARQQQPQQASSPSKKEQAAKDSDPDRFSYFA